MKNLNIAVTGYYGTGSSAVIDLLKEFDCCAPALADPYEHVHLYMPDGLFDLGSTLLGVNNVLRSDAAISSFIKRMMWLNNNNFGWFGSYKYLIDDKFENIVTNFVNEISKTTDGRSIFHCHGVKFSLLKAVLQFGAKILYNRPVVKWGRQYIYDKEPMYYSFPTHDEFFCAARKFVNSFFDICSIPNKHMIYDHLVWPQQSNLVGEYFDENFRMIVVKRDPRDLFILDKYYWSKPPIGIRGGPIPKDAAEFGLYWKRLLDLENRGTNNQVLYVEFEDLVYKYEDTTERIFQFLNLDTKQHIWKKKYFDPEKSIKNTQSFLLKDQWKSEADIIANMLPDYIYNFPYKNETNTKEMFA